MNVLQQETLSRALDSLKNTQNGILEKGLVSLSSEARVLVVGLGGMGLKTLTKLKRELIKRVGDINEQQVAFLSIDTALTDLDKAVAADELELHETCHLDGSTYTRMGRLTANNDKLPLAIRDIVDERDGFNATVDGAGAGQNRLSGRLTIMDPANRQKLSNAVLEKIKKFQSFISKELNIYVVAGVGGGTGSGLCVDVPYLLRDVAQIAGLPENKVKVFGHIYLPNAYGMSANSVGNNRNGYAALKEIDYYMNISELGEEYKAITPTGPLVSKKNIFNTCTLIGGKSYLPMLFDNATDAAVNTCVYSLINKVTQVMETQAKNGEQLSLDTFSEQADTINVPSHLNLIIGNPYNEAHFTSGNASYKYSCVGAASVTFPAEAIADQYVGGIFEKVWTHWTNNVNSVTKKTIDDFEKDIAHPEFLVKKAVQNFKNKFDEQMNGYAFTKRTIGQFESLIPSVMQSVIKTFSVDVASTLDLLRAKAKKVFTDPDQGPLVLNKIFDDVVLEGYLKRVEHYSSECAALQAALTDEISADSMKTQTSLDNASRGFGFEGKKDIYCENLKNLYVLKLKQNLFEELSKNYYKRNTDLTSAYRLIEKTLRDDFVSYIDVLEYIHGILNANANSSASSLTVQTKDPNSILQIGDPSLEKLKDTLHGSIRKKIDNFDSVKMYQFIGDLTSDMLNENRREEWAVHEGDTKSKCAKTFRRFIKSYPDEDFLDVMNSTFASYMDEAYSLSTSAEKTAVAKAIFDYLDGKSAPMFNTWQGNELDGLGGLRYRLMMLPSNIGQWEPIFANVFPSQEKDNMFFSTDQNTIYRYTIYSRIPMWLHADLYEYEKDYNDNYTNKGLHINESSKINYRRFPSLFVKEQWWRYDQVKHTEYIDTNEQKHRDDIRRVFDKALKLGVIQKSGDEYDIEVIGDIHNKPTTEQLDKFVMKYMENPDNLRDDGTCKAGRNLLTALQEKFGGKKVMINQYQIGVQTYSASNDDEAFLLLRRQMSRIEILENEVKYFGDVCNYIEKWNEKIRRDINVANFAKYICYGFISDDGKGKWFYTYKGKNNLLAFATKIRVDAKRNYLVNYMEKAAFENLMKEDDCDDILTYFAEREQDIVEEIGNETYDMTALKAAYEKLLQKAIEITEEVESKRRHRTATDRDEEIYDFYSIVKTSLVDSFSDML